MPEALPDDGGVLTSVADQALDAGMPGGSVMVLGEGVDGALHG